MEISNFSSLLELAAGLNAAYIAVDYSINGYTHILSDKLFEFPDYIKKSFQNSDAILCEKKSLESLKSIDINGKNIGLNIEKTIRDFEIIENEIEEAKYALNIEIKKDCESKNFSSLSLVMFLFCLVSLFLGGFDIHTRFLNLLNTYLGIFLLFFVFIGWTRNSDKIHFTKFFNYSKLSHSIIFFVVSFIISIIITFLTKETLKIQPYFTSLMSWVNIFIVLLPFLNFIIFLLLIRNKGKAIIGKIKTKSSAIEIKCNAVKIQSDELKTTYNFVTNLSK